MTAKRYKRKVEAMLAAADITINGDRPWDVQVHNPDIYERVVAQGMLGVGEGYMDSWWDCEQLDEMICRAFRTGFHKQIRPLNYFLFTLDAQLRNLQNRARAVKVGQVHYDLGDDLYAAMLDSRMQYSCGYWKDATDLETAQKHKLDLIARKLELKPGMHILDIGCGWGGALKYFASEYGVSGVGITISAEQAKTATQHCAGLPIKISLEDYRDLGGRFDRIFSVGMFEHVGPKNYRGYMETVRNNLQPDGLFLLHTIGSPVTQVRSDPWLTRYIFPNSSLPSPAHISTAAEGLLNMEDWHNFPQDYERTLLEWFDRFDAAWPQLQNNYDDRFYRMWRYYLLAVAGGFRAGGNQLWQVVFSRDGYPGGYRPDGIR
jgi:cyclopropane-fatty-acyl-phospholipid synthase